jgi:hypothetical protein
MKLSPFEQKVLAHVKSASWRAEDAMCRKFGYAEKTAGIVRIATEYDWYAGIHVPTSDALFKLVKLGLIEWFHSNAAIKAYGDDNGHIPLKYRVKK